MIKDILLLLAGALIGYLVQIFGEKLRHVGDDYELWSDFGAVSLKAKSHSGLTDLEYRWRGKLVENPHVVDVYFWSAGKKDITSDMFDGETVTVDLDVPLLGELTDGEFNHIDEGSFVASEDGVLTMQPMLIRSNGAYHARFVTEGMPTPRLKAKIANVESIRSIGREKRNPTPLNLRLSRIGGWVAAVGGVGLALYILAVLVWSGVRDLGSIPDDTRTYFQELFREVTAWAFLLCTGMIFFGVYLKGRGSTVSRRARRAVRLLRKSLRDKRALAWLGV